MSSVPGPSLAHRSRQELVAGLAYVQSAPKDRGTLELLVCRPAEDVRRVLEEGLLDPDLGLVGDTWRARGSTSVPGGPADPDAQLTIMSSRVASLVAGTPDHGGLAGDQLYVDLLLDAKSLPAGSRLQVGVAVVELTAKPHRGCAKFAARFGVEALRFVNTGDGKALDLRGRNARVVEAGAVRRGDPVQVVDG